MITLKVHPFADLLPPLPESEYQELKADIAKRGQRERILVRSGHILDGRHRSRACQELGIEPALHEYEGDDLISEIASRNLFRRNLTPLQRAELVAKMMGNQLTAEAKERQLSGLKKGSETPVVAKVGQRGKGRTVEKIAAIAKTSPRTVQRALHAYRDGVPARRKLKPKKHRTLEQIVMRKLQRLFDGFPPEQHKEVKRIIRDFVT